MWDWTDWRSVLSDAGFGNSLLVTLIFIAIVVPAQIVLGLAAASLLARGLPGSAVFRTLYVVPWVCSPLAVAVLWHWILAPTDGAVSTVLGRARSSGSPTPAWRCRWSRRSRCGPTSDT